MPAWTWWYGIKSGQYAAQTGDPSHTSEWLDRVRPIEPAERDDILRAYTTPTAPSWAPPGAANDPRWSYPMYAHAWWTTYSETTRQWAPWTRYQNPDVAGCDAGLVGDQETGLGLRLFEPWEMPLYIAIGICAYWLLGAELGLIKRPRW